MSARDDLIEIVTSDPESSGGDAVWATDLVDAYRAEVLAGVEARLAAMTDEADQYTAELETEGADSSPMYAQHIGLRRARDEVRRMAGGEEATAEAATATPDFFQRGHTYYTSVGPFGLHLRFVCEHVTRDPKNGDREAWGWLHRSDGTRRMDRMWDHDYPMWTVEGGDGRG